MRKRAFGLVILRIGLGIGLGIGAGGLTAGCSRGAAPAQQPAPAKPAAAATPTAPVPGGSELQAGLGDVHHPILTTNPEAQKFFDQGVALTFGFNHEAAIRSFQRAQQLDPMASMPYWGEAWALGTNYNMPVDDDREKQAFEKISKAKQVAGEGASGSPAKADGPARTDGPAKAGHYESASRQVERDYVDAMAQRYSNDMKADRAALEQKYSAAMGALSNKYPDDLDAATLYAESMMNLRPWQLWSADGKPAPGTEHIITVLESVLSREPNHLGANHFYIHAVEASPNPGRALQSAARLDNAAPASGHIVHMPAHIYARTGDHVDSARANAGGAAADEKYLATTPPGSMYGLMYYSHNLMFLAADQMMQGRFADALRPAQLLAKRLEADPHAAMFPFVDSVIVLPVSVLLRFNKYDEVLALPAPPADKPVQVTWRLFARAVSLMQTGKLDDAAKERAAFADGIAKLPATAQWGGMGVSGTDAMNLAMLTLDARLAFAKGERDRSIQLWRKAVDVQDRMPYNEPPDWYYPIRESLGAALLIADKPADAEKVFRDDLQRNPRNPRSLFGLQAALTRQAKDAGAAWVQREFEAAWKNADTKLSLNDF